MKETDYFAQDLGTKLVEAKDDYAKVSMKVAKKHTNALGFTHGGTIFSLADYARFEFQSIARATQYFSFFYVAGNI
jgi:uncharacterized protein (TIGR00369 family)